MAASQVKASTLRQRELARRLKELRVEAGLSQSEAAEKVVMSEAQLSRFENAARRASPVHVRSLCDVYNVTTEVRDELLQLAKDVMRPEWYQASNTLYDPYIAVEAVATEILSYNAMVPGLLQTEGYAKAAYLALDPWAKLDEVTERVKVRLRRQELVLHREPRPPRVTAFLDEAALWRKFGGPEVMREQLVHLKKMAALKNVTVRIIAFEDGAHPGIDSNFILLKTDAEGVSDMVYVEGRAGMQYFEDEKTLEDYQDVVDRIQDKAKGPNDSLAMVDDAISRLSSGSTRHQK